MSQGLHNLFSNPSFVGGLHQDPSSAATSITVFDPARTASEAFTSASGYGPQCYDGTTFTANGSYTTEAACVAASDTWRASAYGQIDVSGFPDDAAAGDKIVFANTTTAGSYVTSKRTTLTLTAAHTGAAGSQTLTGLFDGPVASGDVIVEHKTHYPQFISFPESPVVNKDEVAKLVAQTSYDATKHNYYTGGVAYRWLRSGNIYISGVHPNSISTTSPFGYPSIGGFPEIFQTNDVANDKSRGNDPLRDIVNVSTPSVNTCVIEIGPFGSKWMRQAEDVNNPEKHGSWWWCDMMLLDSSKAVKKVIQSPLIFLEVRV
tara:strand:+ start:392 stop:1345 length:954 start_codon:yes stop_codon:yes gene_type:complete